MVHADKYMGRIAYANFLHRELIFQMPPHSDSLVLVTTVDHYVSRFAAKVEAVLDDINNPDRELCCRGRFFSKGGKICFA